MKTCTVRLFIAGAFLASFAPLRASADTTIVSEDFESYADTSAMQAAWGTTAAGASRLDDNSINADAFPSGGHGAEHLGGPVNVWGGPVDQLNGHNPAFSISPTATQSIRLEGDIYEDATTANKRVSFGLRSTVTSASGTATANLFEIGSWNANTCDPTVAGCVPGTTVAGGPGFIAADGRALAVRMQLFGPVSPPLVVQPNWQYFDLPTALDTSANGVVSVSEVGAAWTHYVATITPTTITISADLYRDGVKNNSKTPGDGAPGVDSIKTWNVASNAAGYNDLRFGGASGVVSAGGSLIFDNIKLSLVDVVQPGLAGDFNSNGKVDAGDYVIWRNNFGTSNVLPNDPTGGMIGTTQYNTWRKNFGTSAGLGSELGAAAVPEPATAGLLCVCITLIAIGRRAPKPTI